MDALEGGRWTDPAACRLDLEELEARDVLREIRLVTLWQRLAPASCGGVSIFRGELEVALFTWNACRTMMPIGILASS